MASPTRVREAPERSLPQRGFWGSGEAGVWLTAGATAFALMLIVGVLIVVAVGGLGFFWPRTLSEYRLTDGRVLLGHEWERSPMPETEAARSSGDRVAIKAANRDLDSNGEFVWTPESEITGVAPSREAVVLERLEYGDFYGFVDAYEEGGASVLVGDGAVRRLIARLPEVQRARRELRKLERGELGRVNSDLEAARRAVGHFEPGGATPDPAAEQVERRRIAELEERYADLDARITQTRARLEQELAVLRTIDGRELRLPAGEIVRAFQPGQLGVLGKLGVYFSRLWEFVSADPREANTQGGIFPAIFGTVLMVFLMTLAVVPLGVMAALYLREYARQGALVRAVRIAVNNLAGIPSIVFGIFGLGFFVYFVGGTIDRAFFGDILPTPTFGTGGILWSALTLSLLTLPVVIVATEEGLAAVPTAIREGSLALGATKWETIWRVVLPAASPGILTGVILAMARAAGEVAPLMLTGAVKIAHELPLSGDFPFIHLERKFMHLGFHIYDVGFQSPNVEAAKPMVYMTTFLLVGIVVALNIIAMTVRNRLRARQRSSTF